ncbi:unnamed protein product [Lymnaea stagnalis]|uniref:Uncharacterized protein n=1 Tax=Lymnaea stagnalis TaxID=6523 RepID=A0AAV2IJQ5_LYMST
MSPTRSKSAASYRALGAKTPSCSTHNSLEDEYNFVRKVIDAMSTYPSGRIGQAGSIRSLRPSTGAPSLFQRRFTLPVHGQDFTTRPHTSKNSTLHLIEVGELFNGKPGSQQTRKMSSKIRTFDYPIASCLHVDQQGYRLGSRRVIVCSPNYDNMTNKTFVLPVASFAHSRLQLTGDVMKIYKSRQTSGETRDRGARDSRKGAMVSTSHNSKDVMRDYSLRKGQVYNSTQMIGKTQSVEGLNKTDAAKQIFPEDKNAGTALTAKELASKPKTPDLKNGLVKSREPVPKLALKGTKHEFRLSPSLLDDSKTQRNFIARPKSAVTESARENDKKDNAVADNGIEGKTEMSNGSGTLTLSIFLPRENEDARLCHRKELIHRDPEIHIGSRCPFGPVGVIEDRAAGIVQDRSAGIRQDSPRQSLHESDFVKEEEQNGSSRVNETFQMFSIGHTTEQSSSRALHCELFGPELCGDCRLCKEREDEQTLQEQAFPDISTNPRQMVAAPLLRYGPLFQSDAARRYAEQPTVAERDTTWTNDRNLNSVVTQNEIRSRIIAAASTAKSEN